MAEESSPGQAAYEVTDDVKKLHADFVAEIHKRELSSSENFDKSILTLSSAALGLSVTYLKDFVPIGLAVVPWALYTSWALFTAAMCATMASFLISGRALVYQKTLAYDYYIKGDRTAFTKKNVWDIATRTLNNFSGVTFFVAMVLTTLFISTNLDRGTHMKQLNMAVPASPASGANFVQRGVTVPTMQPVPVATTPNASPPATSSGAVAPTPTSKR